MRTTVNLADDVAAEVDRLRREKGIGLSEALNELARAGFSTRPDSSAFRQRSVALGMSIDVANIADVLDALDER
jgi:hypothetical protein